MRDRPRGTCRDRTATTDDSTRLLASGALCDPSKEWNCDYEQTHHPRHRRAAIGSTSAFPLVARADQAILVHENIFDIGPGDVVDHADVLRMGRAGLPTLTFDGATGFADAETVVATITLSTHAIDGLGSIELLSSPISGTTSADWTIDETEAFDFQPAIELRYTAPSAADLGCDDHPDERFTTHLGVSATLAGSAGTTASFSADDFFGVVSFVITCPESVTRSNTPTLTTPPTSTLPGRDSIGSRAAWTLSLLFLAMAAGAGALVTLTRSSSTHRYR